MEHEAYIEMAASEDRHWWFRGRREVLQRVISGLHLPANARILELGSGTGGNLAMLAAFGTVTAVELNEAARAISMLKASSTVSILAGALPGELPLASGQTYDLICLFDVLEHVEEDDETLAVVRRHLAPGGAAIITVPAFRKLWGPHDIALHHKRRYEKSELREKLVKAGFEIAKLSYANMLLFPAAVLMRLRDRLRGQGTASGTAMPPAVLNEVFAFMFGAERHVLGWMNLPVGLSLAVVRAGKKQ